MRKAITFGFVLAVAQCVAQVTGGRETVQDAIRFERQKDAAAARQARIEGRQEANRSDESGTANSLLPPVNQ